MQIRKHNTHVDNTRSKKNSMTKQAKTLNAQQLQQLLKFVASTKFSARNRAILLLTHLAGMRIGEVAALRVCDVVAQDGV